MKTTFNIWFCLLTSLAWADHAPQPPDQIKPMLKIAWSRGVDLPQGFQDSEGGFIGDTLITTTGFCSGVEADNAKKPGRYPRGFLRKTWGLDLAAPSPQQQWQALPDFPGAARQAMVAARLEDQLWFWGGFSYSAPFCYRDGFRLSRRASWVWEPLPPLPRPLAGAAASVIGTKIYVFGGADYDASSFYSATDRAHQMPRYGARLIVLDTANLAAGWGELSECPGTPRFAHTMQTIGGRLYVIGGATAEVTRTVVDNWMFDPASNAWTRLRDLPISSGNFPKSTNVVFDGRYIILVGGHQYDEVANPDGTVRPAYGVASRRNDHSGLHNDCFVYDVTTNTFGSADKLPIDNNLPMTVVRGNEIFLIGGETGGGLIDGVFYGHHPDLFLCGKIEKLP